MAKKTQFFLIGHGRHPWVSVLRLPASARLRPLAPDAYEVKLTSERPQSFQGRVLGKRLTEEEAVEARKSLIAAQEVMCE